MILKGKTVVVTGAGGGIGRQLCIQLLEKGARVAGVDISQERLDETKDFAASMSPDAGSRITVHVADITDRKTVCKLPDAILEKHGAIHVLINNAGIIQPFVPFSDLEYDTIQRVININVYGPMLMIRAFLPYLADQSSSYICNVSSMGGFLPVPGQTLYGASKAAVKLLTEGLRGELSNTSIGVSVVFPGGVSTSITTNSGVESPDEPAAGGKGPSIKLTTAEEAAAIMLRGIEKEKPRIIVGKDSRFMDFISRMAPVRAGKMMAKMMSGIMSGSFSEQEKLRAKGCPDGH